MNARITYLFAFILFIMINACSDGTLVDSNYDFKEGIWHEDSLTNFSFNIEDTTAAYQVSYNVRYSVSYPYYNLYLSYYLEDSTSKILNSEMQELILFDKKTGTPLGSGVGDLFDRSAVIFDKLKFEKPGQYTFKTKQFMRNKELKEIYSFGFKLQEVENN